MKYKPVKCYKCNEVQELEDRNIGQDIKGQYTVCIKCESIFDVEPEEFEGYEEDPNKFNYMMLSRLKSDCNYYLGYGERNVNNLWADTEKEHIEEMKRIWSIFPEDKKPEWLTWNQLLDYEKEMVT